MNWNLVTITYNVNRQRPTRESIQAWLESEEGIEDAHIVSFAMQEVPNAEVLKATPTHNTWSEQLTFWMAKRNYALMNKLCLASNMLLVYFKMDLLQYIERIDDRWCRNSLFGTIGYKGTISTRVTLRNRVMLIFITSHFFAEEKFVQERVKQYQQSLECTFPEEKSDRKHIIWQGDLNFRVEGFANSAQFISILSKLEDIDELGRIAGAYDQLSKLKRSGEVFADFQEAAIRFKPTYRILVGSGSYDTLRIPSWCDRVLYSTNKQEGGLTIQRYSACRRITLSDHFPVLAQFHCTFPAISSVQWPCTFDHIPQWETLIPFVCRLTVPGHFWSQYGSNLDWIGLYSSPLEMVSRPISWIYILTCPYDEQRRVIAEFQPLEAGAYSIGYFCSKTKSLQALSNPFLVRKPQERCYI